MTTTSAQKAAEIVRKLRDYFYTINKGWTDLRLTEDCERIVQSCLAEQPKPPSAGEWTGFKLFQVVYGSKGGEDDRSEFAFYAQNPCLIEGWKQLADKINAAIREKEQAGFKRGLTWYERNQDTAEILLRYDEERG